MSGIKYSSALNSLLAPIVDFLGREEVIEICINRPKEFFVETYSGWEKHSSEALTYDHLLALISALSTSARQTVNEEKPLVSCSLPSGERVQIVIPPAVPTGTVSITIRKPATKSFSLNDLVESGLFSNVRTNAARLSELDEKLLAFKASSDWKAFLELAVLSKKNILISGATGSGKTSLSKALIAVIPDNERLISIEDTVELEFPQSNVVRLIYSKGGQGEAKVSAKSLLEASLRMRPDRIFLQELRDASAFDYIRNVNTGHGGSITTIHADSATLAFEQLSLLVKESESGRDLARNEIKEMLYHMIDVVVQIKKNQDGSRQVTEIWFDPAKKYENE